MRTLSASLILRAFGLTLMTAVLAGCGGSAPKTVANASDEENIIFTSALDCEASGRFTAAHCTKALEAAMNAHLKKSPTYKSLSQCETTEGPEKCERMDAKNYRPRLVAVAVTPAAVKKAEAAGGFPDAIPLYPTQSGEKGFRTLEKKIMLIDGDKTEFSPQAVAAAELGASIKKR